jgi:hypothetical protein
MVSPPSGVDSGGVASGISGTGCSTGLGEAGVSSGDCGLMMSGGGVVAMIMLLGGEPEAGTTVVATIWRPVCSVALI